MANTLACLGRVLVQYRLPELIVTDNVCHLVGAVFDGFCEQLKIEHIGSPPNHPQPDGLTERFVDTFTRVFLKSREAGTGDKVLQQFLLAYCTLPSSSTSGRATPAEPLMSRKLRVIHNAMLPSNLKAVEQKEITVIATCWLSSTTDSSDYRRGYSH